MLFKFFFLMFIYKIYVFFEKIFRFMALLSDSVLVSYNFFQKNSAFFLKKKIKMFGRFKKRLYLCIAIERDT